MKVRNPSRPWWALTLGTALLAAAPLGVTMVATSASATGDPPGNNGTVKIQDYEPDEVDDGNPDNDPHVGCTFTIEWYGYDEGEDIVSQVNFSMQSPTEDVGLSVSGSTSVFVGGDPATGPGTETGLDGREVYTLTFDGAAHDEQGYHVRVEVNTPGSIGSDKKVKVFWVQPCTPPTTEPPTTEPPTTPPTTEPPTTEPPTTPPTTEPPTTEPPTTEPPTTPPTTEPPTTEPPTTEPPTTPPTTAPTTATTPPSTTPPTTAPTTGSTPPTTAPTSPPTVAGSQATSSTSPSTSTSPSASTSPSDDTEVQGEQATNNNNGNNNNNGTDESKSDTTSSAPEVRGAQASVPTSVAAGIPSDAAAPSDHREVWLAALAGLMAAALGLGLVSSARLRRRA